MRLKFIFELIILIVKDTLWKSIFNFFFFFTQREAANFRIVKIRDICNLDREFIIVGSCGYSSQMKAIRARNAYNHRHG